MEKRSELRCVVWGGKVHVFLCHSAEAVGSGIRIYGWELTDREVTFSAPYATTAGTPENHQAHKMNDKDFDTLVKALTEWGENMLGPPE